MLLTFIKLRFVIKIFVLSLLSVRFTQVLLYLHCILLGCCQLQAKVCARSTG